MLENPLKNEIETFFCCIANKKSPLMNDQNLIAAIRILEKAQESLTLDDAKLPLT